MIELIAMTNLKKVSKPKARSGNVVQCRYDV